VFFLKDPTRVKRKKEYKAMQGPRVPKSQQTKAGKALNQAKGLAKSEFKHTSMTSMHVLITQPKNTYLNVHTTFHNFGLQVIFKTDRIFCT
jgi:hypothetical protein